jgi:hypothetical protein
MAITASSTILGLGFEVILLGLYAEETAFGISPAARMCAVDAFFLTTLRGEKELYTGRAGSAMSSFW